MTNNSVLGASFRDPSGFLFKHQGHIYRQVNLSYREDYDRSLGSGLYRKLIDSGILIPHEEIEIASPAPEIVYKIIRPEQLEFISYPYEWSFSQLKDAALVTLTIESLAIELGMSLKDASAYNIQFQHGKPVFIDTLSFEKYQPERPWIAYRQFCQHFLAPLSLMAFCDVRLGQLLRDYIDGIPLDLASKLLPRRTWFNFTLLIHIHIHARSQKHYASQKIKTRRQFSHNSMIGLLDSLKGGISNLHWNPSGMGWENYYEEHNYSPQGIQHKKDAVSHWLDLIHPKMVWDLGANTGLFSRLASERGIPTLAFDIDPAAVELNYRSCVTQQETNLLPLVMDLANPSPSIGWENIERPSFLERAPADAIFALALLHHLAIGNNVPLDRLAGFFNRLGKWLIIEFIPKDDSQVQRLLANRQDIFNDYTAGCFETAFSKYFSVEHKEPIPGSTRQLYLMKNLSL